MHLARVTCASAIAIGVGFSALTAGGRGGPDGGPGHHGGPGGPQWGPPPPDQAWRGIDHGRYDHQPFNYNSQWVQPIYNQDFGNWGFWFFGIWIPL